MLTAYDPNVGAAVQRVRLRYQRFDFTHVAEVEVRGTELGFGVLEWALEMHWDQLAGVVGTTVEREGAFVTVTGDTPPHLVLTNPAGDTLVEVDDALLQADWLKDFCVGAEIVSIAPAPDLVGEGIGHE